MIYSINRPEELRRGKGKQQVKESLFLVTNSKSGKDLDRLWKLSGDKTEEVDSGETQARAEDAKQTHHFPALCGDLFDCHFIQKRLHTP